MKPTPIVTRSSCWLVHRLMTLLAVACLYSNVLAAGITRVEVPAADGEPAIHAMVWSPCAIASTRDQLGPYIVQGTANCEIAGNKLPLIVISHGRRASLLSHHDTAAALADAGFVVATMNHPGDCFGDESASQQLKIFETRPRDISRLISFMTRNWPHRHQLDANAIGVLGFSRGGYTALALAGAVPSTSAGAKHLCDHWWLFAGSLCRQLKTEGAQIHSKADPRIRAAVVIDPLNLFDARGLQSIRIPVQLWASEQGGDGVTPEQVKSIKDALPQMPEYHVARGAGHFAYLAPCSPALEKKFPNICIDPKGFDRISWHSNMNAAVVSFFKQKLLPNLRAFGDNQKNGADKP